MQLLRMAMQREQEGDSNANHVSHASSNQEQTTQPPADHAHSPAVHHTPGENANSACPFCILLPTQYSDLPQPSSCDHERVSVTSPNNRPSVFFSATNASLSPSLCNHEFCQSACPTLDSNASSSPDINCNILTSCLRTTDLSCPDNKANPEKCVLERKLAVRFGGMSANEKYDLALLESAADDKTDDEQCVAESPWLPLLTACTRPDSGDSPKRREEIFMLKDRATCQSCVSVNDVPGCELPSPPVKNELNSLITSVGNKSSKYAGHRFSMHHQGQDALQTDLNLRNSVDMDVEDSENDEETNESSANTSFKPYIPQTHAGAGLAGQDQPSASMDASSDTIDNRPAVKVTPVSVIMNPSEATPSPPPDLTSSSLQLTPPIWTTLALHSAAKHSNLRTSSCSEQPISAVENAHNRRIFSSVVSEVTEAMAGILNHNISLSPKTMRPDSGPRRRPTAQFGKDNHNVIPASRACSSRSRRSPLRCTLRQRQGRMPSSALKNPDVFMEALLEDECALYAGRLQSFFKDLKSACDRQEPPDPVAKVLNEGDDMHFIPICDDSACGCRPARKDSTFVSYIAV